MLRTQQTDSEGNSFATLRRNGQELRLTMIMCNGQECVGWMKSPPMSERERALGERGRVQHARGEEPHEPG